MRGVRSDASAISARLSRPGAVPRRPLVLGSPLPPLVLGSLPPSAGRLRMDTASGALLLLLLPLPLLLGWLPLALVLLLLVAAAGSSPPPPAAAAASQRPVEGASRRLCSAACLIRDFPGTARGRWGGRAADSGRERVQEALIAAAVCIMGNR